MRKIWIIAAVLLLASGVMAFNKWRFYVMNLQDRENYQMAAEYFNNKQYQNTLAIIKLRNRSIDRREKNWIKLEVQTLAKLRYITPLVSLYQKYPEVILQYEDVSLWIARVLIRTENWKALESICANWGTLNSSAWFSVKVDMLIGQGQREAAKQILMQRIQSHKEASCLARLALLHADELEKAWQYLDEAYRLEPKNYDIRSFRAQILEKIGKLQQAQVEYVAAFNIAPQNPLLQDQLAEFYRRYQNYDLAVKIWKSKQQHNLEFIHIKAAFWSKIAHHYPENPLDSCPLANFITHLSAGKFWNEHAFLQLDKHRWYTQQYQEVYWLRLLDFIHNKRYRDALKLLTSNTFATRSWHPELENNLYRILMYRITGKFNEIPLRSVKEKSQHQFFQNLQKLSESDQINQDFLRFLQCDEVFAVAFMVAGWAEAGIQLLKMEAVPRFDLDWVAYTITQTLRRHREPDVALKFAKNQKSTPILEMLLAEMSLSKGDPKAIVKLENLAMLPSGVGFRCCWLLSNYYFSQRDSKKMQTLLQNKTFSQSTIGKEALAKIALLQNDIPRAQQIYLEIHEDSAEAKTFLAKQAFQNKDWEAAKKWTQNLQKQFPHQLQFNINQQTILEAQNEK